MKVQVQNCTPLGHLGKQLPEAVTVGHIAPAGSYVKGDGWQGRKGEGLGAARNLAKHLGFAPSLWDLADHCLFLPT